MPPTDLKAADILPFRKWPVRAGHDPATLTEHQARAVAKRMASELYLEPGEATRIVEALRRGVAA